MKVHLHNCNHRGLMLKHSDGRIGWRAEYNEWSNVLREDNPENLRLSGRKHDKETRLCITGTGITTRSRGNIKLSTR